MSAPPGHSPHAPAERSADGIARLAASVIARADREHPADAVLRSTLRETRGLARTDGRLVGRAVFAYYRWLGWHDPAAGVLSGIEAALKLAERYRRHPEQFSVEELRTRAVPAWTHHETTVTETWLRSLQAEPPLWVRARLGQGSVLAKRLGDCRPAGGGLEADALRYAGRADLHRTREFHEGRFEIQDLHSQAVGWLCGARPGETWWDACAGEGGKTLHLADLMENRGLVWASDRASWRLAQLKRRAARAGLFNYRARLWTGGAALPTKTQFDGVLVDAPCSNLGTWHRNPHARWTTRPEDVRELAAVQIRLLRHAVPALKPGARLIYAVCTLTRHETAAVADALTEACPQLERTPLSAPWPWARPESEGLWLDAAPGGGNGMFVAAWRRRPVMTALAKEGSPPL